MLELEIRVKDENEPIPSYIGSTICSLEDMETKLKEYTKCILETFKFRGLVERISIQQCILASANIKSKTLFLSKDAADWLDRKYNCLYINPDDVKVRTFQGMKVIVVPELEQDFMIGTSND